MSDIPHLRQISQETVDLLSERAEILAASSHSVLVEAEAFRLTKTPWDATRLANALSYLEQSTPIEELIRDLDAAAEACAGLAPSNRLSRRL